MSSAPPLDRSRLQAGMRVAVAVSGGADSVGLLRTLIESGPQIGLVIAVVHVHHEIRGAAADEDALFVEDLARQLGVPCRLHHVDTPRAARDEKKTLEEAARHLRYAWFLELLAEGAADAVATAHTLDDQAETVLHRLLRGAWTEGLSGIHPVLTSSGGVILRPFLETRRAEIVEWLRGIGQPWREDASNADTAFTRNRIRHELLPQMETYNPRIAQQLAHMAAIARDEESWWQAELTRLLPGMLLPGRPVRGGGRAVSTHPDEGSLGIELERLRALAPALRRRALRAAAQQVGCPLNFDETERLMEMCRPEGPKRQQLAAELRAEKTARELRLIRGPSVAAQEETPVSFPLSIPGEVTGLGIQLRARLTGTQERPAIPAATLRTPRAGDKVKLQYSRGAKSLKEIFERIHAAPEARRVWPLLEWQGRIVWMRDVAVDLESEIPFVVEVIHE